MLVILIISGKCTVFPFINHLIDFDRTYLGNAFIFSVPYIHVVDVRIADT